MRIRDWSSDVCSSDLLSFANVRLEKYAETDKEFLIGLIGDNLQPNVIYDEALTTKLEQEALSSISLKRGLVQKGELIVRQGAVVNDEVIQRLNSIKGQYQSSLIFSGDRRVVMLGQYQMVERTGGV